MNETTRKQFITILIVLYILPMIVSILLLLGGLPMQMSNDFEGNLFIITTRSIFTLGIITYLSFYFSKKKKTHSFLWILGCVNGGIGVLMCILVFGRSFYINVQINVVFVGFMLFFMAALAYFNYSLYTYDKTRGKQVDNGIL